jgi:hypothetical protein
MRTGLALTFLLTACGWAVAQEDEERERRREEMRRRHAEAQEQLERRFRAEQERMEQDFKRQMERAERGEGERRRPSRPEGDRPPRGENDRLHEVLRHVMERLEHLTREVEMLKRGGPRGSGEMRCPCEGRCKVCHPRREGESERGSPDEAEMRRQKMRELIERRRQEERQQEERRRRPERERE